MKGRTPKQPERRQRRDSKSVLALVPKTEDVSAPSAPKDLLKCTQQLWVAYWKSPLARSIEKDTDLPAISRLFTLYDERERAYRGYKRERLMEGSRGQVILNPLGRMMATLDTEIRQLEDRLGMTPRARLQLGLVFAEAAKSINELNRSISFDESYENDPR